MAQNANTYSIAGAADLTAWGLTGVDTNLTNNDAAQFFGGNAITSVAFGSASDAAMTMATIAPDAVNGGMGTVLTHSRRTTDLLSLNLSGTRGGPPSALAPGTTAGVKSAFGRVSSFLSMGMNATWRWGIDIGLAGAEAVGCAIPR
jgi:hypothetical protein